MKIMTRLLPLVMLILGPCGEAYATPAGTPAAEWTVMIYMNGKNNLEDAALENFEQIARVGSTGAVNVLVELGRPGHLHAVEEAEDWSGVVRFRVKKGDRPVPPGELDLRGQEGLSDMGSPKALADFVDWSVTRYPAARYMLVIWNHGQGWRFQMADDARARTLAAAGEAGGLSAPARTVGGFRAVSFDDDTRHFLYNRDVQDVLEKVGSRLGRKVDLVGFDACLMAMLETSYAFRNAASLMVASEELEPGEGWNYEPVLGALVARPGMSAREFGEIVVADYAERYGTRHQTTMSLLDLSQAQRAGEAASPFAEILLKSAAERTALRRVRAGLRPFGASDGLATSVDALVDGFARTSRTEASRASVIKNYAARNDAVRRTGASGVAIYLPADRAGFRSDPFGGGYRKTNREHVVDFVTDQRWADLIAAWVR